MASKLYSVLVGRHIFTLPVHRYYNAVIDIISVDNESCTLTFEGYNTTEIVRLCDLHPCGWEDEEEGKTGVKKKKVDARANAK